MSLKHSYTLIAPFYDAALAAATRAARQRSLTALPESPGQVLLAGVGTGLDLPHLPLQHRYVGLDLTPAMLTRALPRASHLDFTPTQGDTQHLPFADASFDAVHSNAMVMYLKDPLRAFREMRRVLKPGGAFIGSFNLEEPASSTEPQHLTEKRIKEALLDHLEVQSYRVSISGPMGHEYEPFSTEPLVYEPGQPGILWVRARKPA